MSHPASRVILLVALGLALYLPGLGVEILRHPLEAKYALAARGMLRGDPLLVARLFGELYPDKPPLYFWATAGVGWLNGGHVTEVTARLPAVIGAMAGVLLVYRLGIDLFGGRAGLVSAVILATSNLYFWYARQGHPDQFLTAWVTLASLALWRSTTPDPGCRTLGWTLLAYAAMALGVLSKGLLGLLLPLLGAAAYLVVTGPIRAVPARLRLGPGLVVFLAVVLGWYAPAVAQNGLGYLYETVVHQHVVRYTHTWVHKGAWYYYFGEFTAGFFPWSLFLPGAIALGWRARHAEDAAGGAAPVPQPFLFPLAGFVTGFVFFSLSTSKRGAYLLPIYPSAALMVGWLWDRTLSSRATSGWVGVPLALVSGAAALLALAVVLVPRHLIPGNMADTLVPAGRWQVAGAVTALLVGAAAVGLSWQRGRRTVALGALVAVQAGLLLAVTTVRAPQYEARFPVREFAARVQATLPRGQPLFSLLDDYNFIVAFYLDRPLAPVPGPSELLAARAADTARYALVDARDRELFRQPGVHTLQDAQLGPKRVVLIRLDPLGR